MNDGTRESIKNCIQEITHEIEEIERDCEEQRYAPIPALLLGQLKAYKRCLNLFENVLEDMEDNE